ncbi:MAG: MBL fold metallo-hydrolase [Chloroflexi bacterium]|nr:MBL fold metallo-hydrolase [Chloroflexota bacterium]
MPLRVVTYPVGSFSTNAYVVAAEGSGECVVIDPGAEGARLVAAIRFLALSVRFILTTHGHGDHTGGAATVKRELGGLYVVAEADAERVANPDSWIVSMMPGFEQPPEIDMKIHGNETLQIEGVDIGAIATPGHTPGSVCYSCEKAVFTGDTLFKGSIGRFDLPGGDGKQELKSIRERLLTLPADTVVFPGHGPRTSIEQEIHTNPFLQPGAMEEPR